MMKHHITKYWEDGTLWAESWIQVNAFGRCFCFSRRRIKVG